MNPSDDLMLVPGPAGFEAWRARSRGGVAAPDPEAKGRKAPGWIGLPTKNLVCVPMTLQGPDAARREAAARLELEAASVANEGAGAHELDFLPVPSSLAGREHHVIAVVQAGAMPDEAISQGIDSRYAPAMLFHRLKAGQARLWREQGGWVLGIPNEEGALAYCQAISAATLDADAGAELRCIFAALDVSGALPRLEQLAVSFEPGHEGAFDPGFEDAVDLPVRSIEPELPVAPATPSRLLPAAIVRQRHERSQRRMTALAISALVLVLLVALGAFGGRLMMRQKEIRAEMARLDALEPQLEEVRAIRQNWSDLSGALDRDRYPVELYHQLMLILPVDNIRITKFEVGVDAIVLTGEAKTQGDASRFREVLVNHPPFKAWNFEEGFLLSSVDPNTNMATFNADAKRRDLMTASTEPTF